MVLPRLGLLVVVILSALIGPRRGAAENVAPHDNPGPVVSASEPVSLEDRWNQALFQIENETIARYLTANPGQRTAVLGRLLHEVEAQFPRVQNLQALARSLQNSPAATPAPGSQLQRLVAQAAVLSDLEQRLTMRRLVLQLGAPKYADREAAADQLRRLGRRAIDELSWGMASADLEIADACLRMLVAVRGRGFIGIQFQMIPAALSTEEAVEKKLPFVGGVAVEQVLDGQAGQRAGLEVGDVIIGLGPVRIVTYSDLLRAVAMLGPKFDGPITIVRSGKTKTVRINLGLNPEGP